MHHLLLYTQPLVLVVREQVRVAARGVRSGCGKAAACLRGFLCPCLPETQGCCGVGGGGGGASKNARSGSVEENKKSKKLSRSGSTELSG
jgi:hypothetical protein